MSATSPLLIRAESPVDDVVIAEINRLAFGGDDEVQIVARIRRAAGFDPSLSLVAELDGRPVGHTLFSPIHIDAGDRRIPAIALAPMAVLPEHQRQGIGSQMVRAGLDACKRGGHRIVIVLGHAEYYPRFGFEIAAAHGLRCPYPAPDEAFMVLGLTADALDDVAGLVVYPAAFG